MNRGTADMQMSPQDLENLVTRVPLFQGLTVDQVQRVLEAGEVLECKKGKVLCRDGDKSTALYILLVGRLVVRTGEVDLSHVDPRDHRRDGSDHGHAALSDSRSGRQCALICEAKWILMLCWTPMRGWR